jgi:hypothetical protein
MASRNTCERDGAQEYQVSSSQSGQRVSNTLDGLVTSAGSTYPVSAGISLEKEETFAVMIL